MTNPICKLRCSEKERWKRVDFFLIYEQFSENVASAHNFLFFKF